MPKRKPLSKTSLIVAKKNMKVVSSTLDKSKFCDDTNNNFEQIRLSSNSDDFLDFYLNESGEKG